MSQIERITIVGGIHGDELLGIYLVKKFRKFPRILRQYTDVEIKTLLANPKAIALRKRYIDIDLNRCFSFGDLNNNSLFLYEQLLAKAIYRQLKGSPTNTAANQPQNNCSELLIDIHTSTANMGMTLLISNELPFNLNLAGYLVSLNPAIKIVSARTKPGESNRLRSICPYGFTLEIGAIAHGVLDPIWFAETERLIFHILDYVNRLNRQQVIKIPESLSLYTNLEAIYFPQNEVREIEAMIHPQLHGKDYCALHPKEPLFVKFDNSNIFYQGHKTVYPIFINESAYGEKNIAMYFTTKKQLSTSLH